MASILILGGGFGGLAAAHELRARLPDNHDVTVVAAADHFYTGFAKLWDLVGTRPLQQGTDRKSTRLNSSHANISYAAFCLKKKPTRVPPWSRWPWAPETRRSTSEAHTR